MQARNHLFNLCLALTILIVQTSLSNAETNSLGWKNNVINVQRLADRNDAPVISEIALHPDGKTFAVVGDDHFLRIYDTQTQKLVRQMKGHTDWVRTVSYSRDGSMIATGGNDRKVILWDAATGKQRAMLDKLEFAVSDLTFDAAGTQVAVVGFNSDLTIYDIARNRKLETLICPCNDMTAIALSPDGSTLAAAGRNGILRVWHYQTRNKIRDFQPHSKRIHDIVFSNDGEQVFTCSDDRHVAITRINKVISPTQKFKRIPAKVTSLAIIGENRIASGSTDNKIRIWNIDQMTIVGELVGHVGTVTTLAQKDSKLFSGSYDTRVRIWESAPKVATKPTFRLPVPPTQNNTPIPNLK